MPTENNIPRPLQRPNLTVRGRAITMKPMDESSRPTPKAITLPTMKAGPLTQSFFARAEEQEATGYENLAPDDPTLAPPELEFDSFDKIPKKRASWFALGVSVLVVAAVGLVTWRSFHFLSRPGSSIAAASRAMVQAPTPAQPAARAEPAMSVSPSPQAEPTVSSAPSAAPAPSTPTAATKPSAQDTAAPRDRSPAPAVSDQNAASAPTPAPAPPKHAVVPVIVPLAPQHEAARPKHQPLRGYVWSPEKHTIVPAEPSSDDPVPSEAPPTESPHPQMLDSTPAEEPQPAAPEQTSPAPFEPKPVPAPVPSTSAPIIE